MKSEKTEICLNNRSFTKVIIDTATIIQQKSFVTLMRDTLIPELSRCEMKLHVPKTVIRELNEFIVEKSEKAYAAKKALECLEVLTKSGYVEFEGNPDERTDTYLMCAVVRARMKKENMLVITQNYSLASDIVILNQIRSNMLPSAYVKRVNTNGELENFDFTRPVKAEKKQYLNVQDALKRMGI